MKWNDEDIERVEKFIDIKNRGMYCDSNQLNEVYNRVLEKNATPTSCGSCMRHRISELETALKRYRQELEKVKSVTVEELNEEIIKENNIEKRYWKITFSSTFLHN